MENRGASEKGYVNFLQIDVEVYTIFIVPFTKIQINL